MKKLFYYLLLPLLSILLASCGDDKNEPDNPGEDPNVSVDDPEGTVALQMLYDGETSLDNIKIDDAYNFTGDRCSFVSLGAMKGLGNVTAIPTTGWAPKVAVIAGHGYVAHDGWSGRFYRIYAVGKMVDTGGGVMGYTIKYQTPFAGPDEELQLETDALAFEENGGTATVKILNKNFVPFIAESSHEWVRASPASTSDFPFITDAVYIEVDNSGDNTQTEATVTLTTGSGKTATISITRSPVPFVSIHSGSTEPVLDPAGDEQRLSLYGNIDISCLTATSSDNWCTVRIERANKPATVPYQLKYIAGKPVEESMRTSSGSTPLHYYDLILSAEANDGPGRYASIHVESADPYLSSEICTARQDPFKFELEGNTVSFAQEGGTANIPIYTTGDLNSLQAKSSETWCKASFQNIENTGTYLIISAEGNTGEDNRSAAVDILLPEGKRIATVTVDQTGRGISVQAESVYFDRNASNQTIAISVPEGFKQEDILCSENWLTATLTGANNSGLTIRVSATTEDRTATITFTGFSKQVEVRQSKYAVDDAYSENGVEGTVYYLENGVGKIYKQIGTAAWSTEEVDIGASDENDGRKNMEVVKRQPDWQNLYPAFALVEELNTNGAAGWYLPAINECGRWETWSSTEFSKDSAYYLRYIYADYRSGQLSKTSPCNVIAIHQFEY